MAAALTIQVARDFAPEWGAAAVTCTVGGRGEKLHFFDSAHQATDYGWHVVDGNGRPYAHVFTGLSVEHGSTWTRGPDAVSVTASHEVLEMLADPGANGYSFDGHRRLWAGEVCDPVQQRSYRIVADGVSVAVSDFVLPAFFNPWAPAPYDHLGVLTRPFSLDTGGYAMCERATTPHARGRRVEPLFDDAMPAWQQAQKLTGWGRTYWRRLLAG